MKKFFSMIAAVAAMFAFAACSETAPEQEPTPTPGSKKLATPELTETHTETSITVAWAAVTNADSYIVNFDGKNYTTAECAYTFENLNAGDYTIRVKATGAGYENSDNAKIVVTLTGATEVDWFEATAKPAEVNEAEGYGPYNAVEFTWKGTGVASLSYGFYYADSLQGIADKDIKAALTAVNDETVAKVNSENGLTSILGPVDGGTDYVMCVLVANAAGVEFFTKVEVSTETAEASEAAKAWIGTWEVKSTQKYSIDQSGTGTVLEEADTFTVIITESASDPNEVVIDGFSVLGDGFGYVTVGYVEGETLSIMNGTNLGASEQGFYYYWLGWYNIAGEETLSIDAYPSNIVTLNGETATSTNKFDLFDEAGNAYPTVCNCSDVFGVSDQGQIYFLIEAFPGVYRTGDMTWTKTEAAASAKAMNFAGRSALASSVVVAM